MAAGHVIFLFFIALLITIQCHQNAHYNTSYLKWSSIINDNNNKSCAMNICVHANPSMSDFKITFKEYEFDFFDDSNWSKIVKMNNPNRRRLGVQSWAREKRERWRERREQEKEQKEEERHRRRVQKRMKRRYGSRWRKKYEEWEKRRDKDRGSKGSSSRESRLSRLSKNGARAISILRMLQRANEWRQHRKLYNKLYKLGKMIGKAMRKNKRDKRRRRRRRQSRHGCGCQSRPTCPCRNNYKQRSGRGKRNRKPMGYKTVLGPPHVVGHPSYILGSMPMHSTPVGYYTAFPFGAGVQTTMPMIMNRRRMFAEEDNNNDGIKKCVLLDKESVEICVSLYLNGDVVLEYNGGILMEELDGMTRNIK